MMTRDECKRLAEVRLAEAQALLAATPPCPDGAYYLAGYAVECALKACVIARVGREPDLVFRDREFSKRCFTHNLRVLLKESGLEAELDAAGTADGILGNNWKTAAAWTEQARYGLGRTELAARQYVAAVVDPDHGVLTWMRQRW